METGLLLLVAAGAFLLGSFPTAFVLVRKTSGKDLRTSGSGNIGALNAFEVSRSKSVGIAVLLIDLVKGALPVLAVLLFLGDAFVAGAFAYIAVVLGHNYSPWIGFKGGRGLAPALGASIAFNPAFLIIWIALWLVTRLWSKDVHVGNIFATAVSPFVLFFAAPLAGKLSHFTAPSDMATVAVGTALFVLIFLKHLDPLRALIAHRRSGSIPPPEQ